MGAQGPEVQQETPRMQRLRLRGRVNAQLSRLASGVEGGGPLAESHTDQTVGAWVESLRPGIVTLGESAGKLREETEKHAKISPLVAGVSHDAITLLRTLERLCKKRAMDGKDGDPIAVARMLDRQMVNGDLERLEKSMASFSPEQREPIDRVIAFFRNEARAAIPSIHPAVHVVDVKNLGRNPRLRKSVGEGMRMGVAAVAGIGGLITTFMALKNKDSSLTAPALYWGTAALAAGWGDITADGSERLNQQLSWLTKGTSPLERQGRRPLRSLEDFRAKGYAVSGDSWATFVERLYAQGRPVVGNTIHQGKAFTAEDPADPRQPRSQVTQIVNLAPADIQADVRRMLDSREGATPEQQRTSLNGTDFRAFYSTILRASRPETRAHAVQYIRSGTSPRTAI